MFVLQILVPYFFFVEWPSLNLTFTACCIVLWFGWSWSFTQPNAMTSLDSIIRWSTRSASHVLARLTTICRICLTWLLMPLFKWPHSFKFIYLVLYLLKDIKPELLVFNLLTINERDALTPNFIESWLHNWIFKRLVTRFVFVLWLLIRGLTLYLWDLIHPHPSLNPLLRLDPISVTFKFSFTFETFCMVFLIGA